MATQTEVAEFIGLTDRQIRNLQAQGHMHRSSGRGGMNLQKAVQEYITYLKAGRAMEEGGPADPDENGGSELDRERKRLNNEIIKERLKALRKENVPVWLLTDSLVRVVEQIGARCDSMLQKVKLASPDMPERVLNVINKEIVTLKNSIAAIDIDLTDYEPEDEEDE
ncbi:hypothetical protein ACW5W8_16720 [Aeromonas aquatilis]